MDLIWQGNRILVPGGGLALKMTPTMVIPLTSMGDGTGVATLSLMSTENIPMTIDGNGMFYDNAGGTLNPGKTRTIQSGVMRTFYLKVTSGTCRIVINHNDKLTRWGDFDNYGWQSYDGNSPRADIKISQLARSLTHFDFDGNNDLKGSVADLPRNLIYAYIDNYYTLNPDSNITGNVSDLPRSLTHFTTTFNVMAGSLSDIPTGITRFYCTGSNTIGGDVSGLPSSLTYITCSGNNVITGNTSSIPRNVSTFWVWGNNTMYGSLSDVPTGVTYLGILGSYNTVSGYSYPRTWPNLMKNVSVQPKIGYGLNSTEVDNLLIDLASRTWTGTEKEVWLKGGTAPRTAASNTAVTTLQGKGVTVTTN
jgi:hypothetical protein